MLFALHGETRSSERTRDVRFSRFHRYMDVAAILRCGVLACAIAMLVACGGADRVTSPVSPSPSPPPLVVPPPGGPATAYTFSGPLEHAVRDFTRSSRFVLYENGAFTLLYLTSANSYAGAYQREGARVVFWFADSDSAIGTLKGDMLEVRFSDRMQHSDFEDAVYRRSE